MSEPVFSASFVRYVLLWTLAFLAARLWLVNPIIRAIERR